MSPLLTAHWMLPIGWRPREAEAGDSSVIESLAVVRDVRCVGSERLRVTDTLPEPADPWLRSCTASSPGACKLASWWPGARCSWCRSGVEPSPAKENA